MGVQLAAARIMVGIGQAGATAPSNALISDLFEPRHRAAALSVYAQGLPAGILLGFLLGGLLAEQVSWRMVLFAFALPGLVLAPLLLRWLPETMAAKAAADDQSSAAGVIRQLLSTPAFLNSALGSALFTIVWLSLLSWLPTFFLRSHGLATASVAAPLALVLGVSQMIGLLAGGLLSDRLALTSRSAYLWVCAAASLLSAPFLCAALVTADWHLSLGLLFPGFLLGLMQGAPALAVIQAIGGPGARAVAISTYLVIVNLLGGLGSQLVGVLSDRWSADLGPGSLGAALLWVVAVCGPWSALHFALATRSFGRGAGATGRSPDAAPGQAGAGTGA